MTLKFNHSCALVCVLQNCRGAGCDDKGVHIYTKPSATACIWNKS